MKRDALKPYERGLLSGLTPNVVTLGVVSFLADVSSEMLYPLIPIFLTTVLGAPMAAVGFIEGAAEATASFLKALSGRISDLTGRRRPFVFAGYGISSLAKPVIALAIGWPLVLVARVADRFGKGLRVAPRDALIADSVGADSRGKAFGWHRAMDTMGAVLGPLVALALVAHFDGNLRPVFLLAFIPGALGALAVLVVSERRHEPRPAAASSISYARLPVAFRKYLIAWGVFAIANSSDVFLILKAKQVGFSTSAVILAYTLYNLTYAGASPILGGLSDKLGRKSALIGGLCVFALVYLGFAFAAEGWHVWALFAIYGLYMAATDGVGKAFAVDLVPQEIRAGALGLLGTVTGVATLIASSAAGALWSAVGSWAAFAYGAGGALAGAALLTRIRVEKSLHVA
jgi:MFS family permease